MATSKAKTGTAGTGASKSRTRAADSEEPQTEDAKATEDSAPAEENPQPTESDQPDNGDAPAEGDGQADGDAPAERDGSEMTGAALAPRMATMAAPMTPPNNEAGKATWPVMGRPESSNDPVAANAALRTPSGSTHKRLVGENGSPIALNAIFSYPAQGSPSMVATVTQRVYEEFRYPNTSTPTTHLLFPAGARIPVGEAQRVEKTYQYAPSDEIPDGT